MLVIVPRVSGLLNLGWWKVMIRATNGISLLCNWLELVKYGHLRNLDGFAINSFEMEGEEGRLQG